MTLGKPFGLTSLEFLSWQREDWAHQQFSAQLDFSGESRAGSVITNKGMERGTSGRHQVTH